MKYFTYVSQTKIEMLYSQIEPDVTERESSIGFDLKLLKGETKAKSGGSINLYKNLEKIVNHLEKLGIVGDMKSDKEYLSGTLVMRAGSYAFDSPVAFWGYNDDVDGIALALAGSSYHLIGEQRDGSAHSHSLTGPMVKWFLENLGDKFSQKQLKHWEKERSLWGSQGDLDVLEDDVANGTWLAATQMSGSPEKYEFLAKVLHRSVWPEGFRWSNTKRIILGSPLYVCLC
jgi:hypothetical protein